METPNGLGLQSRIYPSPPRCTRLSTGGDMSGSKLNKLLALALHRVIFLSPMSESLSAMGNGLPRKRGIAASICTFGGLILAYFVFGLRSASAQSLGDTAREQRSKVQAQGAPHVYTNEDLSGDTILVPADQERFNTAVSEPLNPTVLPVAVSAPVDPSALSAAMGIAVAPPIAVPQWPAGTPLGDVARYYRQQKQQRQVTSGPVVAQKRKEIPAAAYQPKFVTTPAPQLVQKTKRFIASTTPAPKEPFSASSVASSVTVSAGDSLWKIASRYLGDGNQWREIASANPQIGDPNRIHAGERILLPSTTAVVASNHQVRVQSGDSLWKIAKAQWGTGQAWSCIAESNPQIDAAGQIYPGQVLTLPSTCSLI